MRTCFCASLTFAIVAGVGAPAVAQQDCDTITGIPVHVIDGSGGGYHQRAEGVPFDLWSNANTSGLFRFLGQTNGKHVLEDITFAPGPWGSQATRVIDAIDFSVWGAVNAPFRIRIKVWNPADVNYAGFTGDGTSMINQSGTPMRVMEFPPAAGTFAYGNEGFVIANNPLPGGPLAIPAALTGVYLELQIIDTAGNPMPSTGDGAVFFSNNSGRGEPTGLPANYVDPAAPGNSVPDYGRDTNNDGIFAGAAAAQAAAGERRYIIAQDVPPNYVTYGYSCALRGDIVVTPPACTSFTLGASNVFASASTTLANNGVAWYCVTLPTGALDGNLRYIDFDTNGSGADVAIGLFTSAGIKIAVDDESGGSGQALLSAGIGRRTNTSGNVGALDYQGWNFLYTTFVAAPYGAPFGFAGLPAGTYYVAVATAATGAVFGDGFFANGGGAGGSATLRIRTNVSNGALNPSDPPAATRIVGLSNEDPIVSPGGVSAEAALFSPNLQWFDVQLCHDADAGNPVSFQVSSSPATEPPGKAIYVFDTAGNLKGSATGGRPSTPSVNFGGSDPFLGAGRYYIALAFNYTGTDVDVAPTPSTNGRFHLRPRVNDGGYTMAATVMVPWSGCATFCCLSDYDGDGDVGTDFDIQAFFSCLGGNCCATCPPDADFNCDGDVGTDADIEAFFRVLAGGQC
jgi:hypothetical protein